MPDRSPDADPPATWRFRLPGEREAVVVERLHLAGFFDFAVLSAGAVCELHCWPTDHAGFAALARGLMLGDPQIEPTVMPAWMSDPDAPVEFLPGVWLIGPSAPPPALADVVLRLHLSDCMGSGRHPTSRSAAGLLRTVDLAGRAVADVGCGSGLLGLLALRWGAASVELVDRDAAACRLAAANLALNGVAAAMHHGDLLDPLTTPVDLMVANLWTEPALALLAHPRLPELLPHGDLIIAGIPSSERPAILAAGEQHGMVLLAETEAAWWWAARLQRR